MLNRLQTSNETNNKRHHTQTKRESQQSKNKKRNGYTVVLNSGMHC
jgi:hypothetical protein